MKASLSEALLLFNEEVKPPHNKGEYRIRIKRLTTLLSTRETVGSVVVIRPTTPSYGTPLCHEPQEFGMDPGSSFSHLVVQRSFPTKTQQRPRFIAVPPKSRRVSGVCPSDTTDTPFLSPPGVPRLFGLTYNGRSEEGIRVVSP